MQQIKKFFSQMSHIIMVIAAIVTITGFTLADIIGEPQNNGEMSQEELDKKVMEMYDEIRILNGQLEHYMYDDEYLLVNGEGKRINPATLLNYHSLISKMEELRKYYYFIDLITYMDRCNYNVSGEKIDFATEWFFEMEYNQQAEILSNMFVEMSPYTYKVATEYKYYADMTEDAAGNIEYTNIRAEATKIEERGIPIFICTQLSKNPFGLVRITDENEGLIHHQIDDESL